jgi:predicted transcriptional regulator
MKKVTLKISAPKCGATSDELKSVLSEALGAEGTYVNARVAILPPDIKARIRNAVKAIREVYEKNTLPWILTERVCTDEREELVKEEVMESVKKAKDEMVEIANTMNVWLPTVKSALGRGAEMVALPDPNDFTIEVDINTGEPSKAGRGLPRDATQAEVAEAVSKAKGYEAVIDHLIGLAEQIGPGKEGSAAALRLKEDAATAAKIGAVDKEMVGKLNKLVGAVLTATGNAARKGAKAKIVSAVVESGEKAAKQEEEEDAANKQVKDNTEETAPVEQSKPTQEGNVDAAIDLI